MRFASLLLLGLLATGLHAAESTRVMRPVQISYQAPPPAADTEKIPMPTVPPDDAVAVEHEIVEADPLPKHEGDVSESECTTGCGCDAGCESCPQTECCQAQCCPSACCPSACCHGCCGLHGHHHCSFCSRCNMPQHMPYFAQPSTYYYFRPYNHLHIPLVQQEAVLHGATTQNPYDTDLFEDVYREFEGETVDSSETLPVSPQSSE